MRYPNVLGTLLLFGMGLASMPSQAQNNPLFTFDENGHGTIQFPAGPSSNIGGVLAPDPGPGGLASALTYDLQGPPSIVAGDVFLQEGVGGPFQDVIRFNPAGTGSPAYPASLVFYSDNTEGTDALADSLTPPTSFYTNTVTIPEVGVEGFNGAIYTPTANQPGFIPGFSVTYQIFSDTPEPGSVALFVSMGLTGTAFLARRRKRARKVA